jgi:arginase family enzyme
LLLDHIGSTWPPIYAAQWLLERLTIRVAGEHFTRRQLPLVKAAGLEITIYNPLLDEDGRAGRGLADVLAAALGTTDH